MGRGVIRAGSEKFIESEWHDNPMPSLYNDDAIHAFRIRMSEELQVLDLAKVNDLTLKRLLDMGCVRNFVFSNHFVSHFSERKTLFPRTLIPDMTSHEYHEQRN